MHSKCNLKYSLSKKIHIAFHNWSNYDYHCIKKGVAEEFKNQFTYLGENTEKYITFIILLEKEVTRIDKSGEKVTKKYILYIAVYWCVRFMTSSWSIFVNNLSEGILKIKC